MIRAPNEVPITIACPSLKMPAFSPAIITTIGPAVVDLGLNVEPDGAINERTLDDYFGREVMKGFVEQPFKVTETTGHFDVFANIKGGGLSGQAGALRHAIARALLEAGDDYRGELKRAGLLRRDPRMVERKKYGLKKARKRPQFSKR